MSEFASDCHAEGTVENGGTRRGERAGRGRRGLVAHSAGPLPDDALAGVLRSSQNAVAALGPGVPIEAVIQGPGVAHLAEGSVFGEAISAAVASGVRVLACGNSLRSAGVAAEHLLPGVGMVPAAIAHLAERQWDGWAYLRL
ncbi:DsrE family protein [Arthrobacter sp. TB 26]|uniref:DsrE family protein n=1 Tax=Arthrobacter sp. TB 26 TaxID=494420 RepID=UPI000462590D|nr:DsrE family protein [Arthrobacter sp. TB 26]